MKLPTSLNLIAPALLLGALSQTGCQSFAENDYGRRDNVAPSAASDMPSLPASDAYLIGPEAARTLGYRVDWGAHVRPRDNSGLKLMHIASGSVFTLDGRNIWTRLDAGSGKKLTSGVVGDATDAVHGITYIPQAERAFFTTNSNMIAVDTVNGALLSKQALRPLAATAPVVYGPMMIYGSSNGEMVWHSYSLGQRYSAYRISRSIGVDPVLAGRALIAVGGAGEVVVLDVEAGSRLWGKDWIGRVASPPVASSATVYVASTDQTLYAFDLASGRTRWQHLSESPLHDSPTLIGDRVYQQIPSEGLVCFEALPADGYTSTIIWTGAVRGNVVGKHRGNLLVWDAQGRQMSVVDAEQGTVLKQVQMPYVRHLHLTAVDDGDLYASSDDGRVVRLNPR